MRRESLLLWLHILASVKLLYSQVSGSGPRWSLVPPAVDHSDRIGLPIDTIFLDVDNTLYKEAEHGIEQQIVRNIHSFCKNVCGVSPTQADEWHKRYGSTVEGLRGNGHETALPRYYEEVYRNVDVRSLLLPVRDSLSNDNTGYSHAKQEEVQRRLRNTVRRLGKAYTPPRIALASNSPRSHVESVVQALGLCQAIEAVFTPDSCPESTRSAVEYPTKASHPGSFFGLERSAERKPIKVLNHALVDDSSANVKACSPWLGTSLRLNQQGDDGGVNSLTDVLGQVCGWQNPSFSFSAVEYLRSKASVDRAALHRPTWKALGRALGGIERLRVVDVGAGLLGMLRLILFGHGDDLPSLLKQGSTQQLDYVAYESNISLRDEILGQLTSMGFKDVKSESRELARLTTGQIVAGVCVRITVKFCEYEDDPPLDVPPHLVIGCCFADLFQPQELVKSLVRCFMSMPSVAEETEPRTTLVYLPITFAGMTQYVPPAPIEGNIPSDTIAFSYYASALTNTHGHNLEPWLIEEAVRDYGGDVLSQGRSVWKIKRAEAPYLWETMLHFFQISVIDMHESGWNMKGWFDRTRRHSPRIEATNTDFLFRLPHLGEWSFPILEHTSKHAADKTFRQIVFQGPRAVNSELRPSRRLGPQEVRIETEASLVSSGTEMKIFQGDFSDAPLDVNIESMATERLQYPLTYGYSLVGRITECGSDIRNTEDLIGRLAFTFSAHASQVVVARDAIQLVPNGIDPFDAIFLPSVETALSIVHDVNPRFGEDIAVFGQGLIGLLVTALLAMQHPRSERGRLGGVSAFDLSPERLAVAGALGAKQALFPDVASRVGPFDVAVEVSGNRQALQTAIDVTRRGGRIVVGSWYGNGDTSLRLGMDFHRSHKKILVSQVSEIPAKLSMLWTKERRFEIAWELVRQLRPSRYLSRKAPLIACQDIYESLGERKEMLVAFEYKGEK